MVLTILLILVLLAGDFLVPAFFPVERLHMVVAMDAIAFCTLCLTIWKAG